MKAKLLLVPLTLAAACLPWCGAQAQSGVRLGDLSFDTGSVIRGSEAEAIVALEQEARRMSAAEEFSGAILIAKNGKPAFQKAYGFADRELKIANTLNTKFRFGSMAKMFTGVAALQLVQEGKIKLDASIATYLPEYPNVDVAKVTIHQLLTHTGGTGDFFGPLYQLKRTEMKEHGDYIKLLGTRGLRFDPGSRFEYSNYGMILLGRIIEVVSGESYYDYVEKHIFKVAGMTETGNTPNAQPEPNRAVGYTRQTQQRPMQLNQPAGQPIAPWRSTDGIMNYRGNAAGGGFSTVGDFLKFAIALTNNRLLDANHTQLLLEGKVDTGRAGGKYAYGFGDGLTVDGVRSIGHNGGAPGMNGQLSIYPASGYVVIGLSNFDPPAAENLTRFVSARLPL